MLWDRRIQKRSSKELGKNEKVWEKVQKSKQIRKEVERRGSTVLTCWGLRREAGGCAWVCRGHTGTGSPRHWSCCSCAWTSHTHLVCWGNSQISPLHLKNKQCYDIQYCTVLSISNTLSLLVLFIIHSHHP